jgi:alkylmercury lyase-like protein
VLTVQPSPELVKEVRKFIFDHFESETTAPVVEQIMRRFSLDRTQAFQALLALQDAHHIVLVKGTQRILMAFPFSGVTTPFRVVVGGRTYYANCAWDSIAIHVTLDEEERIESYCHHCAEEVKIHLKDQGVVSSSPKNAIVYLALPASRWWDDIVNTCSNNMVFFSSEAHLREWKERSGVKGGAALSVEQMIKLSLPLYKAKMSLDYSRPPKKEMQACFASLGLTGDFWKL